MMRESDHAWLFESGSLKIESENASLAAEGIYIYNVMAGLVPAHLDNEGTVLT